MGMFETDWKDKYLKSLEELERKEKSWELSEAALRRCISHLSFVGDGRDRKLDNRLEDLRNRVRGERKISNVQGMIDAITDLADKLPKHEPAHQDLTPLSDGLIQVLDEAPFPVSMRRQVKALRGKLKSAPLDESHLNALRSLVIESLQVAPSPETDDKKGGLLGRLFHKEQGSEPQADQPGAPGGAPGDDQPQDTTAPPTHNEMDGVEIAGGLLLDLIDRLRHVEHWGKRMGALSVRARNATTERALNTLVKELADILQIPKEITFGADYALLTLLEKMDLPEALEPEVTALKGQLAEGVPEEVLPKVLEQIAGVVSQAGREAEKERQEVESFLLQLTQQLQALDSELVGVGSQGREIYEGSRRFGESVDSDVTDLHASVADASDLDELKTTVSERLDLLQERLREHRTEEDQRVERFEQDIVSLKSRLQDMEQESLDLKQKVDQARTQAFTDALTGLNNRHAFDVRMEQEYARWKRYQSQLSMIVLDVDLFKKVNDTYGHHAGDKVLHIIGEQIGRMLRDADFPARYGGEEFVVLLPEVDLQGAREVAEKIRLAVEEKGFHAGDRQVTITVSCGVAQLDEGDSEASLFQRADKALYQAKSSGRNRTCTQDDLNSA
ncbi:MAG: GGDEF domain-containing protein [Candidatus Sedimenticola sp. 20ELBAFRAG]